MKKVRQNVVLFCLGGWLFMGPLARADVLPLGVSFKTTSRNGAFFSLLTPNDSSDASTPLERAGMLRVYTQDSSLLWQQPINLRPEAKGILDDRGDYFCYVEMQYSKQATVVVLYRKGKKPINLSGKQFPFTILQVTHILTEGLGNAPFFYIDEFRSKLIIYQVGTPLWSIDLETEQEASINNNQNHFVIIFLLAGAIVLIITIKIGTDKLLSPPQP